MTETASSGDLCAGTILKGPLKVRMAHDQRLRLRDGIRLSTDTYLPGTGDRHPTVLLRHPYNTRVPWLVQLGRAFASFGLGAVFQNVRGRFGSEGQFRGLAQEGPDGVDTVEWLKTQDWFDGRLLLFGFSYSGFAAQALVRLGLSGVSVSGMINLVPGGRGGVYRNGAMALHWALPWAIMMSPLGPAGLKEAFRDPRQRYGALPLATAAPPEAQELWKEWVDHSPLDDAHWDTHHIPVGSTPFPCLLVSGWQDLWVDNAMTEMLEAEGRPGSSLVIGPWHHQSVLEAMLPDLLLAAGPAKTRETTRLPVLSLIEWMTGCLGARSVVGGEGRLADGKGGPAGAGAEAATGPAGVRYRLWAPSGVWMTADVWPPPGTRRLRYFLASGGRANTSAGDGRLTIDKPGPSRDEFDYDPDDPVPTAGGNVWPFPPILKPGPADQTAVEARADVLVYTSEPLTNGAAVLGRVDAHLWVESSARDTDFTAKLVDVGSDGTPLIVGDSIARCRFRVPGRDDAYLRPGEPVALSFAVACVSHRFEAGHRVCLEVSSSNFPKWDRNLNTGESSFFTDRRLVAHQRVHSGGNRASHLVLTVIDDRR